MIVGAVRRNLARADAAVVAALLVLSAVLVGLHVHGYTKLSPVDELQHIDYLYLAPGHPEPDDKVGQEALHQQVCRSIDAPGFAPPGCVSGRLDPNMFQERGFNTAAVYTPLYYTVTRAGAETLGVVSPVDDLVTAGRLMGGAWLALGLALTFAAGRMRGIGRWPLAGVLALIATAPAVLYPSSTIAPDASALAVGGGLLLALTWWERRPSLRRAAVFVALAAVAALVKMTYLCVVAALALYLLMRWVRGLRSRSDDAEAAPRPHRALLLGVAAGAAALVATVVWSAYVASLPQISSDELPAMATQFQVPGFPWAGLSDGLLVLVQPLSSPWVLVGNPQLTTLSSAVVSLTLTAGAVAAAVFGAADERARDLARATLVAAVVAAVGFIAYTFVSSSSYIPLPSRYGMSLVAPLAISAAACVRTRTATAIIGALAVVGAVLALWRLAGLA